MKKTIMVLAFACVFAVALAFGCTCGDKNKGKAELKGEYTIELYSDYTLQADGTSTSWSSSDESVVSVSKDGMLIGLRAGVAEIYSDAAKLKKYVITVVDNGTRPQFDAIGKKVFAGDKGVIETKLNFGEKSYTDYKCKFNTDSDVVTFNNDTGEFTANKEGIAEVSVMAAWRGVKQELLAKKITIQVVSERAVILSVSRSDVSVYAVDKVGDVEFKNTEEIEIVLTKKQGIAQFADDDIKVSPAGAAVVSGGKLIVTGKDVGESKITVTYTDKTDASVTDEVTLDVTTKLAIVDFTEDGKGYYANTNKKLNALELSDSITNIISDYATITDRSQKDKIIFADGTVSWENYSFGSKKWLIANERYGCEFTVSAYSLNVNSENDFLNMFDYLTVTTDENGFYSYDGHIVLNADLNFADRTFADFKTSAYNSNNNVYKHGFGWTAYSKEFGEQPAGEITKYRNKVQDSENYNNGFVGKLDGQGHSINRLIIGQLGMFPSVGEKAEIKDVAFSDTIMAMEAYGFGVTVYGKFDNILMDVIDFSENKSAAAGLACIFGGTLTNSIVHYECTQPINGTSSNPSAVYFGAIALNNDKKHIQQVSKSYVICALDGTVGTYGDTNVYYTFKGISNFQKGESAVETCTKDYSEFNKSIWDFESRAIPVFKTYKGINVPRNVKERIETVISKALGDAEISINASGVTEVTRLVNGETKNLPFSYSEQKLTLLASGFNLLSNGNNRLSVITTDNELIEIEATVADMVINTEEEFLTLFDCLTVTGNAEEGYTYDGYVLLNANLDFSDKNFADYKTSAYNTNNNVYKHGFGWVAYSKEFSTASLEAISGYSANVQNNPNESTGFVGTIDGRGHTVKGLIIGQLGLFPSIATGGMIKNISFVDTQLAMEAYGFALEMFGTIDNCYIDAVDTEGNGSAATLIANEYRGKILNSIILWESEKTDAEHFSVLSLYRNKSVTNSYFVLGKNAGTTIGLCGKEYKQWFTYNGVENFNKGIHGDYENDKTLRFQVYNSFNKEIWDFDSYVIPVFKTYNGSNIAAKS